MNRREFLARGIQMSTVVGVFQLVGCGKQETAAPGSSARGLRQATLGEVILYDTYAMALYFDGGLGPTTGILKVDYILFNQPILMDFWHGHGGKLHQYTFTPDHYSELKKLKKVTLETTMVDSHRHKLFVDPTDTRYRVPGAQPVSVPTET